MLVHNGITDVDVSTDVLALAAGTVEEVHRDCTKTNSAVTPHPPRCRRPRTQVIQLVLVGVSISLTLLMHIMFAYRNTDTGRGNIQDIV
jgi:hypothetical protein